MDNKQLAIFLNGIEDKHLSLLNNKKITVAYKDKKNEDTPIYVYGFLTGANKNFISVATRFIQDQEGKFIPYDKEKILVKNIYELNFV